MRTRWAAEKREDGVNGSLLSLGLLDTWGFSTPDIRFILLLHRRGRLVLERVLGPDWRGILASGLFSGCNYHVGLHQRCWAHLLREVRSLQEAFASDTCLAGWHDGTMARWHDGTMARRRQRLHALYDEATSRCWIHNAAGYITLLDT
jgi:hypothetical protein